MSEEESPYELFKRKIEAVLKAEPNGLTWAEIKRRLNLPQKVPNNRWVKSMEKDIGLIRERTKGKLIWRLGQV